MCTPAGESLGYWEDEGERMCSPPELKTYCLVKRVQEKGTCAYKGQKNYPWVGREGLERGD